MLFSTLLNPSQDILLMTSNYMYPLFSIVFSDHRFPTFDRDIPEMSVEGGSASATKVDGVGNTISNTVLTMSNNRGLDVSGENNTVTNVLVDHTDWLGTLTCVAKSNTCMIVLLSHTHTHTL